MHGRSMAKKARKRQRSVCMCLFEGGQVVGWWQREKESVVPTGEKQRKRNKQERKMKRQSLLGVEQVLGVAHRMGSTE